MKEMLQEYYKVADFRTGILNFFGRNWVICGVGLFVCLFIFSFGLVLGVGGMFGYVLAFFTPILIE